MILIAYEKKITYGYAITYRILASISSTTYDTPARKSNCAIIGLFMIGLTIYEK